MQELNTPTANLDIEPTPEDIQRHRMTLNMGPQHPSTHGVLRIVIELEGETIKRATPDIG